MTRRLCVVCRQRPATVDRFGWEESPHADLCVGCMESYSAAYGETDFEWCANQARRFAKAAAKKKAREAK